MDALVKIEKKDQVAIIYLNQSDSMTVLSTALMDQLSDALIDLDGDESVRVIIVTGNERSFAIGANIKEMAHYSYGDVYKNNFITSNWETVTRCRKPVIAAVSGYALGGGCEFVMMCDMIIASDDAKFSQPEIGIGTTPGAGGSQRLTRAIGKAKAMEMCLTGRMMGAKEAQSAGLITRAVPSDQLMQETLALAKKIAEMSQPVAMMIKECVNAAFETGLQQGINFERKIFHATFALNDQTEGMRAFCEKRNPDFKDN